MRAVMDTNVLVAALRSRRGASFELFHRLRLGQWTAVLSNHHTDQAGKWRDAVDGIVNLPAKVHPKKTKLGTDALAGFDDI